MRKFTVGLYMLRAYQLGLTLEEMEQMDMGDVIDMLTESGNDKEEYDYKATQEDYDAFRG